MFFKKGLFFALALTFGMASSAFAGNNAAATLALDYVADSGAGNQTNEGVVTGTVTGTDANTKIVVELFANGVTTALAGARVVFNFDAAVVKFSKAENSAFGFSIPEASGTSFAALAPVTLGASGFLARAEFTPAAGVDLTGKEFTIGATVELSETVSSIDTVTTATVLSFNAQPKLAASAAVVVIPRGGQATATVTASGFAAGATVTFSKTVAGSATVTDATAGNVYTLTASGSGAATVTVTATDGTTTTAAVVVQFDEQVPVELASFAGEVVQDNVVLNWATASQTNNAGFRVLRSTDQENYEVVSELISGAGTTDVLMPYSFTDVSMPASEQVFYVLEQIDLDGTIHRSNPIEVVLGARFLNLPSEFASAVYPNPFNPATTISYDMPVEGDVSIVIYDAIGQEIRQLVNNGHTAGRYSVQWDAKDALGRSVGSGVYIAKIKAGTFSATQKMLLLK